MNNDIIISKSILKSKKVPLLVYLSDDVDEKLRKHIALKYQKVEKGLISFEVENAIKNYISVYNKQQSTQKSTPPKFNFSSLAN